MEHLWIGLGGCSLSECLTCQHLGHHAPLFVDSVDGVLKDLALLRVSTPTLRVAQSPGTGQEALLC